MADEIRERDVRLLYRLLNHGNLFTLVDCRSASQPAGTPALDRRLLTNETDFVNWAKVWNGKGNCYVGRNPREADGKTIGRITALSFDIDPVYDKSIGATDEQNSLVLRTSRILLNKYPGGYLASSGNGALVLYPLPRQGTHTNEEYTSGLKRLEEEVRKDWPTGSIVDQTYDAARLIRLVGTKNCKGREENQRTSRFVKQPKVWETTKEICSTVIALANSTSTNDAKQLQTGERYEPWVVSALAGLPAGQKHNTIIKLAGYFGGKRIPIEVTTKLILEANANAQDKPAAEGDVIFRINDVYKRIKAGTYRSNDDDTQAIAEETTSEAHIPETSLELYEHWSKQNAGPAEFPTALASIDDYARLARGQLHVIVARTGLGKSTLATDLSRAVVRAGKRVLFFSTEMNFNEVWERYWAGELKMSAASIHDHRTNGSTAKLEDFKQNTFKKLPFIVYDDARLNIDVIAREIEKHKPDLVLLDYFQYIETDLEHRPSSLSKLARQIKTLAQQKNVAFLITAQAHDKRDWKTNKVVRSNCTDVKETKSLVDTASVVMVLNWANQDQEDEGQQYASMELDVQKNRFGPKFKTLVKMDRSIPTFYGA